MGSNQRVSSAMPKGNTRKESRGTSPRVPARRLVSDSGLTRSGVHRAEPERNLALQISGRRGALNNPRTAESKKPAIKKKIQELEKRRESEEKLHMEDDDTGDQYNVKHSVAMYKGKLKQKRVKPATKKRIREKLEEEGYHVSDDEPPAKKQKTPRSPLEEYNVKELFHHIRISISNRKKIPKDTKARIRKLLDDFDCDDSDDSDDSDDKLDS